MKVKEIRSLLEQAAPEAYAMGWDNSGLILGRTDKEVKKILITVDVDDNTVDQALLQCGFGPFPSSFGVSGGEADH